MLTTDSRLYRAILDRDGDALRAAVPEGVTRQLTVGSKVYTIRREQHGWMDIVMVHQDGRFLFSESVPAEKFHE